MLDDGAKAKGERIQVVDVAQVLARSLAPAEEAATRPTGP
jgi:hypothetical protein